MVDLWAWQDIILIVMSVIVLHSVMTTTQILGEPDGFLPGCWIGLILLNLILQATG